MNEEIAIENFQKIVGDLHFGQEVCRLVSFHYFEFSGRLCLEIEIMFSKEKNRGNQTLIHECPRPILEICKKEVVEEKVSDSLFES